MERLIVASVLTLFISSASAMDVEQQIRQDYQQIQQQTEAGYQQRVLTRCEQKVKKYEDKVKLYPDSVYYNWKLDSWRDRCRD